MREEPGGDNSRVTRVDAGAVSSYQNTNYVCQAGEELVRDYGFTKLAMRDPEAAPLGAVIVYGSSLRRLASLLMLSGVRLGFREERCELLFP